MEPIHTHDYEERWQELRRERLELQLRQALLHEDHAARIREINRELGDGD